MGFHNIKSVGEKLGISESEAVELVRMGRLHPGPLGLVDEQDLQNFITERAIDAENENRNRAFAQRAAYDLRLLRERRILLEVFAEQKEKLLKEARRRIAADPGGSPPSGTEGRELENIFAAQ
jgi:hypothetical protein